MGKKVSQLITNLRMYVPFEHFTAVEMRVGRIIAIEDFPEARKPAWKLTIDFGKEIGQKHSSAQLVDLYTKEELKGKLNPYLLGLEYYKKENSLLNTQLNQKNNVNGSKFQSFKCSIMSFPLSNYRWQFIIVDCRTGFERKIGRRWPSASCVSL